MSARFYWLMTAQILAVMALVSIYTLTRVGMDATLPIHWGANGQVDGVAPAPWALAILPLTVVGWVALMAVLAQFSPSAAALARSGTAWRTACLSLTGMLALTHFALVGGFLGHPVDMGRTHALIMGVFLVLMGNVMGKVRPNGLLGIRTPWTRNDEWVWDQTHRFGGRLFVAGGFLLLALTFWLPPALIRGPRLTMAVLLPLALISVLRSYLYWRVRPNR
ncbi:putative membrane protein [Nitrospirillum amazonense]|uniref:Putative membrane protein n=1 Tax=Nitrospirillum amazonense TaxID=28077 RepID=A0A560F4W2_9PROT|nr:SdpI family protein [Nitrospirillum amazonense]TWB16653.1 putative membrane protein [Nitrospirillum amazonense]